MNDLFRLLCAAVVAFALSGSVSAQESTVNLRNIPHPGTDVRLARADALVHAPIARVLEEVTDYADYVNWMPNVIGSRVLAQRGNRAEVYLEVTAAADTLTLWARTRLRVQEREDGTRIIETRVVESNLEIFVARWELRPEGNNTHVTFDLMALPDLPIPLPSSVVTNENRRMARRSVHRLRHRLETAG